VLQPDDVVASRVLPTLRSMVARRLALRKLTERAIAQRMGLTQAAVSKYLRGRGRLEPAVEGAPAFRALADRLAEGLADERMTPFGALAETQRVVRLEEDRGVVCVLHEKAVPALRGMACDLCVHGGSSELVAEQEVLGDLRAGLRALEAEPAFAALIPSVGSNLARAKSGAKTPLEVAAVPGRIFEMRGAVRVSAGPEFGASRHVAEVVLAAHAVFKEIRAALNVRADVPTLAAARSLGWHPLLFDAAYEGRHERIASALKGRKKPPMALYHAGAFGIEPVMYVVGPTASEVVAEVLNLATKRAQRA
jgi:XRE family transcriptional regulator, thiamine biosynthesis regulator